MTSSERQPESQLEQADAATDAPKVPEDAQVNPNSPFYASKELKAMLAKQHGDVYEVNEDVFFRPQCLRGTSTTKLTESSTEWDRRWASLDAYIANEQEEEQKKADAKLALDQHPVKDATRKRLEDDYKLRQDNCSKQVKIREIFGPDSPYHPNQLVGRQHLPPVGLCQQELLYKLACKISDMKDLHKMGFLKMDPYEFVRWRVNRSLANQLPNAVATGVKLITGIIRALGDPNVTKRGLRRLKVDALFREAVILAAAYGGRLGAFKKRGNESRGDEIRPATNVFSGGTGRKRRLRAELKANAGSSQAGIAAHFQPRGPKKQVSEAGAYGGVNQWRAQKLQRK